MRTAEIGVAIKVTMLEMGCPLTSKQELMMDSALIELTKSQQMLTILRPKFETIVLSKFMTGDASIDADLLVRVGPEYADPNVNMAWVGYMWGAIGSS